MPAIKKTTHQLRHGYTLLELMIVLAILVSIMAVSWPRISKRMQLIAPREAALQIKADLAEAREQAVVTGEAWAVRIERGTAKYEMGPVSTLRGKQLSASAMSSLAADPLAEMQQTIGGSSIDSTGPNSVNPSSAPPPTTTFGSTAGVMPTPIQIRSHELPAGMIFDDGFAHQVSDANAIRTEASLKNPNLLPLQPPLPVGSPSLPTNPIQNSGMLPTATLQQPTLPTPGGIDNWKVAVIFQPDGRATESEIRLKEQASENKIRLRVRGFTGGVTIDKLERKPLQPQDGLLGTESEVLDRQPVMETPQSFTPAIGSGR